MPTTAPHWLTPPEQKWLECSVEGFAEPGEYAVEISLNGLDVAAVVPETFVKAPKSLPDSGHLMVMVVANLQGNTVLVDLPATPVNWTRRISVESNRLVDDAFIRPRYLGRNTGG